MAEERDMDCSATTATTVSSERQTSMKLLEMDVFSCSICMELLYKPCVNSCGHTFCFWCFHRAMNVLRTEHPCPLCRSAFCHFPAVCWPLHRYLVNNYTEEMEEREKEICQLEKEEYIAESPSVCGGNAEHFGSLQQEFKCVECGNLAAPPTILSCGHVVCCPNRKESRSIPASKGQKCPVAGCVGKVADDGPSVCTLIEKILSSDNEISSATYDAAVSLSQKCNALDEDAKRHSTKSKKDEDVQLKKGDICRLQGLAPDLNGKRVKISSYDSSAEKYEVELVTSSIVIRLRKKSFKVGRENLEKINKTDGYIHYGIGCDGCGQFPITGRRYKCQNCSEEIGFDLCGDCFDAGVHLRPHGDADSAGRFNQKHLPSHEMKKIVTPSFLNDLHQANPHIPLTELFHMVGMELSGEGADPQESTDHTMHDQHV